MMKTRQLPARSGPCFPITRHPHLMKFCMRLNCSQPPRSPDYPRAFTLPSACLLSLAMSSTLVGKAEKRAVSRKARVRESGREGVVVGGSEPGVLQ